MEPNEQSEPRLASAGHPPIHSAALPIPPELEGHVTGVFSSQLQKHKHTPRPFLKYDGYMHGDWRSHIGQKVNVKYRKGKRWGVRSGILQVIDHPFACECCPYTVPVLTDHDGNVKWSAAPSIVQVGHNVSWLVNFDRSLVGKR